VREALGRRGVEREPGAKMSPETTQQRIVVALDQAAQLPRRDGPALFADAAVRACSGPAARS